MLFKISATYLLIEDDQGRSLAIEQFRFYYLFLKIYFIPMTVLHYDFYITKTKIYDVEKVVVVNICRIYYIFLDIYRNLCSCWYTICMVHSKQTNEFSCFINTQSFKLSSLCHFMHSGYTQVPDSMSSMC